MQQVIPKRRIPDAIAILGRKRAVVAPVRRRGSVVFMPVDRPEDAILDYATTILPLKKFFLPANEVLLRYDIRTQAVVTPPASSAPRLFFGVHNYDLQGVLRLDHAFGTGVRDETWFARRRGSLFAGVSYVPDEHHFAASVGIPPGLKEGFDIFLTSFEDCYAVDALTEQGEGLLEEIGRFLEPRECGPEPVAQFKNKLRQSISGIKDVFHGAYTHPVWNETARACLSCGTCSVVCPTCYCFDVDDQTDLGASTGARMRRWDSCQFPGFAAVAGGESFREKRGDRVRHRMSRKFAYITDDKGMPFCVGCGRCVRQCTAKINIVDVMNALL
jgi:sulfhydrogenase subunit beta (sulfur reductase)